MESSKPESTFDPIKSPECRLRIATRRLKHSIGKRVAKRKLITAIRAHEAEVLSILEDAISSRNPDDASNQKLLSWEEATDLLKDVIDLPAELNKAANDHQRWGIVDKLIEKGFIKDAKDYANLFMQVKVSESDMKKLERGLRNGEEWLSLFDNGKFSPAEIFNILIEDAGIPILKGNHAYENLSGVRKIDPKNIPNLAVLPKEGLRATREAFKTAAQNAPAFEPKGPSLQFTRNLLEPIDLSLWSTQRLLQAIDGKKFISPQADLMRFRAQLDITLENLSQGKKLSDLSKEEYRRLLKEAWEHLTKEAWEHLTKQACEDLTIEPFLPDQNNTTVYPTYVFPDSGDVLSFGWDLAYFMYSLRDCNNGLCDVYSGVRIVLG